MQPFAPGAFHDRRIGIAALVLALLKLWFISAQPINGLPGSAHDDQLFLELAGNILAGEWLGPYSQYTLIKGCGYPVFIALAMAIGLPLPLAEHGLYLLATWLLVRALRPLLRNDLWSLGMFALIVWQPMSYTIDRHGGNILRQNLYTPLTLLVFAGLIGWSTRRASGTWTRAGWASLLGLSLAWLYLTREETVWIVPSTILLALTALIVGWRERQRWLDLLWPGALAAAVAITPVLLVCGLNARHYGWFGTVEVKASAFVAAYGALNRVTIAPPRVHYPFQKANRLAVYEVSPSFNALKPHLEGDLGRVWAQGAPDGEIHGALWIWALRDAVMLVTHAQQASVVLEYYQRIADEVNAACDDGRLPAGPPRHSLIAPWHEGLTQRLTSEFAGYLRTFLLFEGFNARSPRSHGTAEQLRIFRDMTQWHLAPPDQAPELSAPRSRAMRVWRIGALQDIGSTMRWVCVSALAIGATCWLWAVVIAVRRRRWPSLSWWISTAAIGGAMAVWTVSFAVHVTGWHDTRPLRFSQGYPLLMLFSVVAAAAVFQRGETAVAGTGSNRADQGAQHL